MPNWGAVLKEISQTAPNGQHSPFDIVRRKYIAKLHQHTKRNVICYYSAFLSKPNAPFVEISDEDKNGIMLCVHRLDRSLGLDLILHTGGGDIGAVESMVFYLREMFGTDIRAIIPQLAMSAGTLLACACKEMLMGKHSAIGPVDPQIGGVPAIGLIQEFERAFEQIKQDQRYGILWDPILSRITPSLLEQCRWAIARSEQFLGRALSEGMLSGVDEPRKSELISNIVSHLTTHDQNRGHNRHIHYGECMDIGLVVNLLEDPADRTLQDLVLTIHHTYMHTLSNTPSVKIIENHLGRAHVRMVAQQQTVLQIPEEFKSVLFPEVPIVAEPEDG